MVAAEAPLVSPYAAGREAYGWRVSLVAAGLLATCVAGGTDQRAGSGGAS